MPIRRGAANVSRFRVDGDLPKDLRRWLQKGLSRAAFEPIDRKGDQDRSAGFVEIDDSDRSEFSAGSLFHGEFALFAYRIDRLKVGTGAVRSAMLTWVQSFEQKNGRLPGRRERATQKETVTKALRAKQEPVSKVFEVSFNTASRELLVWATSRSVIDEVESSLSAGLEVKLIPRVPSAFVSPGVLDGLIPTPELFVEAR